jgi:hypothetical protein
MHIARIAGGYVWPRLLRTMALPRARVSSAKDEACEHSHYLTSVTLITRWQLGGGWRSLLRCRILLVRILARGAR